MNENDLLKLADLNNIKIGVKKGWYPLLMELIEALDHAGWDRKIFNIKEKYGRLEFQILDAKYDDLIDEFAEKSEEICEDCGKKGIPREFYGILYTSCEEHTKQITK